MFPDLEVSKAQPRAPPLEILTLSCNTPESIARASCEYLEVLRLTLLAKVPVSCSIGDADSDNLSDGRPTRTIGVFDRERRGGKSVGQFTLQDFTLQAAEKGLKKKLVPNRGPFAHTSNFFYCIG